MLVEGPPRCTSRITELQRRWSLLHRSAATTLLLACALLGGLPLIGLDWYLRGGRMARTGLLAIFIISVGFVLFRWIAPLWKRLTDDRAALLIEQQSPHLGGRLVTAVQLASPQARGRAGTSENLYNAVRASAEESAGSLDVRRILPGTLQLRRTALSLLVIALIASGAALHPATASTGVRRLFMPWSELEWPRRTRIELVPSVSGPIRVVRGGTLVLEGRVGGLVPSTGRLWVEAGPGTVDRAYFDIQPDGAFTVRYRPVTVDLLVRVEVGDASSTRLKVEMVPPPDIAAIEAECVFPEYTRLRPAHLKDGNIQAVYGSQIKLSVTATKPLSKAAIAWEEGERIALQKTGPTAVEALFGVEASRSYRIHLTDELGFHNDDPVVYRIEMIDNTYPRIERVSPSSDKQVTPRAVLPITARITDDFGVTQVVLCCRKGEETPREVAIPLERTGTQIDLRHAWPLEELALAPGTSLEYWLEARDAGEHATKSKWPSSRPRRLQIVEEAELARQLADQLEGALERLAQLEAQQTECAQAVNRLSAGSTSQPTPPAAAGELAARALAEKWRQDRLARTAGQLAERLSSISEDYAISRIGDADRVRRLQIIAETMTRIAGADMPAIVLALEEAAQKLSTPQRAGTQPSANSPKEPQP